VQSALRHHLAQIANAELVAQIPAHAQDDHFAVEVPPSKQLRDAVQFAHRWPSTLQRPMYPTGRGRFAPEPLIPSCASSLMVWRKANGCWATRLCLYSGARHEQGSSARRSRRWPSAQSKYVGTNWPQASLYFFQSHSMALAISLAAERNHVDFLRRRSLRMLPTWRLLPK
jgi:hypothetical protein